MRTSAAEWAERISAWRESGSTAEEFAQAGGYRAKLLVWWASELDRRSRRKTSAKRKIVMARIRVKPAAHDALAVVVGEARVVVSRGFDAALLRDVVAALGPTR